MPRKTVDEMEFAKVYPMYVQKAERKGRTKAEVDTIIGWLLGYDQAAIDRLAESEATFGAFIEDAPAFNPNAGLIKGVVCGVRVEEVVDPFVQKYRYLDKLVDELAKGKAMEKILRS